MPEIILRGGLFSGRMGLPRTKWLDNMVMAVRSWRGTVEDSCDASLGPPRADVDGVGTYAIFRSQLQTDRQSLYGAN
jgi:hypothetical protein